MAIDTSEILVISTTDSLELARKIASALVENHEAACVNIVPGVVSIYVWQGKNCESGEWLMLIKSSEARFEAVRSRIRCMHSYQVPEVIKLPIAGGDTDYLGWMAEQLAAR
jgi:periplasmic divalent cation tolerance protein